MGRYWVWPKSGSMGWYTLVRLRDGLWAALWVERRAGLWAGLWLGLGTGLRAVTDSICADNVSNPKGGSFTLADRCADLASSGAGFWADHKANLWDGLYAALWIGLWVGL